jgi:hypothetical protein
MARRKKVTSKKLTIKRRRRSRMGAISSDTKSLLMQTLGGVAGAVVGSYVGKAVSDMASKNSTSLAEYAPYIDGGVQVAIGIFLPKLIKQQNPLIKGVQMGMMINGGLTIVKATGALDALGAIPSGYNVPMVSGADAYGQLTDARSVTTPMVAGMNRTRAMGIAGMA